MSPHSFSLKMTIIMDASAKSEWKGSNVRVIVWRSSSQIISVGGATFIFLLFSWPSPKSAVFFLADSHLICHVNTLLFSVSFRVCVLLQKFIYMISWLLLPLSLLLPAPRLMGLSAAFSSSSSSRRTGWSFDDEMIFCLLFCLSSSLLFFPPSFLKLHRRGYWKRKVQITTFFSFFPSFTSSVSIWGEEGKKKDWSFDAFGPDSDGERERNIMEEVDDL